MVRVELEPALGAIEGSAVGDVDDNECTSGILEVVGNEGSEAFLTGGVPEL